MATYICPNCEEEKVGEFEEAPECEDCEVKMEKKVEEKKEEKEEKEEEEVEGDDEPPVEVYDDEEEDW